ncbi:MAG: glutamine-hydrolyzing carbamoyl-phosphate synthase small subunit [Spirochaetales bacterium]|nr:glutamine-hydrolyzing carbamoyl-phosphate synthase small subunit [Spirochaetales bacterium]
MRDRCFLCLDDGSALEGVSFGHCPPFAADLAGASRENLPAGEIVFNTGMAGYQAIFTDPSYTGQLIVMTYPHIGNYGTRADWSESGPEADTRKAVKAQGVIVRNLYSGPVPAERRTLDDYLKAHGVSGITGIDTRRLTLRIRDSGNCNGVIVRPADGEIRDLTKPEKEAVTAFLKSFPKMEGRNLVTDVGTDKAVVANPSGAPHICLVDYGVKANIIRELVSRGCRVSTVPSAFSAEDILSLHPDGVVLSNGPGDPRVLDTPIACAAGLIGKKPLLGICLGHQLFGLALGAKVFKMKFGHHGVNHPVRDERTKRVIITSQNHGFAVDEKTLPKDADVLFRNCNDGTVEGLAHRKLPLITAQFHPEANPGPKDAEWIFDEFLGLIQ